MSDTVHVISFSICSLLHVRASNPKVQNKKDYCWPNAKLPILSLKNKPTLFPDPIEDLHLIQPDCFVLMTVPVIFLAQLHLNCYFHYHINYHSHRDRAHRYDMNERMPPQYQR